MILEFPEFAEMERSLTKFEFYSSDFLKGGLDAILKCVCICVCQVLFLPAAKSPEMSSKSD